MRTITLCFLISLGGLLFFLLQPLLPTPFDVRLWFLPDGREAIVRAALIQCQQEDQASLTAFETDLENRLSRLENRIEPFLDELWSLKTIWRAVTGRREEHVTELWRRHFSAPLQDALEHALAGLAEDLRAHQNAALAYVSATAGDDLGQALQGRITAYALASLNVAGQRESLSAANRAVAGQVAAMAAGGVAGTITGAQAGALLGGPVGALTGAAVGLGTDLAVSWLTEEATKEAYRERLRQALRQSAQAVIHGNETRSGVMAELRLEMQRLQAARLEAMHVTLAASRQATY